MSFDISKQIIHLLYIALLVGCILNTGGIVFWHFNPNLPSIRVFEKDLKDVEFPLVFRICINKINQDDTELIKLGYSQYNSYFRGISMYNRSNIGWRGHTEDGKTIGTGTGII